MNQARYRFYMTRKTPPQLKKLPPTDLNLMLHALRAHLQVLLWKAADKPAAPEISQDIRQFGWDIIPKETGSSVMPALARQPVVLPALSDIVSCGCASATPCSARCSCTRVGLSCTEYCKCGGTDPCRNSHTVARREIEEEEII